jgi:DNA gyrase subunit B
VLTVLHAGGKFDNDSYKVSGGLHGVGVSVVNALSETLDSRSGATARSISKSTSAAPDRDLEMTGTTKRRGTKISFKPDAQIFEVTSFSFDILAQRLRELAFLNGGILITLDDERDGKNHKFHYEGGIVSFVQHLNKNKAAVNESRSTCAARKDGIDAEIALAVERRLRRNDLHLRQQHQHARGWHPPLGFRAALTRHGQFLRDEEQPREGLVRERDRRRHPRGPHRGHQRQDPHPQFEGQTKTKLGNTEVKGIVEAISTTSSAPTSRRTRRSRRASSARRSMPPRPARRRARRAIWSAARARSTAARCPGSSPIARSAIRR